jgi:hypothetical protein
MRLFDGGIVNSVVCVIRVEAASGRCEPGAFTFGSCMDVNGLFARRQVLKPNVQTTWI